MKLARCEVCHLNPREKSSIIDDYYYKDICYGCYDKLAQTTAPSSGEASFDRQRDLEDHLADVIQPYEDGKPSADFIHLYPDKAAKLFTSDEISQAERS